MTADTEARKIVDAYCRAHDYALITREQRGEYQRIREVLALRTQDLDAARARVAELTDALRPALPYLDQHPGQGQETAARLRGLIAKDDR